MAFCVARIMLASVPAIMLTMGHDYQVANSKGGVGKSNVAVHLADWLHEQGP